ncbi:MAG: hypothetical protein FWC56_06090 [Phycisphaerae bacterium]|nr:hypothetical protein [Phycisphaerae bacterium]
MRKECLILLGVGLLLLVGCVEGLIQVGPREWPAWMQDNPFSTMTTQPASQQQQGSEKSIKELIEERL